MAIASVQTLTYTPSANEQELRLAALEAQMERDNLLSVLEGRRAMITADGQQYARVEWITAKELVK